MIRGANMNKYLGIVDFTNLVYFLEADDEDKAKIKIHDKLNKHNNQLLLNMPLNRIHVVKTDKFNESIEKSENKIIEIESFIHLIKGD